MKAQSPPRAGPTVAAILVALPMVAVLAAIVHGATGADPALWAHLTEHVLARVVANTAVLVVGVVVIAVALGTSLAWLTAACEFPGRGFFAWALYLPMAMPAYVLAFVAVATLDYAGAVPTALRGLVRRGLRRAADPLDGGVIAVLGFASYPYVYLMARGAFLTHGARVLEAAQSLGYGPWAGLVRVAIPLARPWLAGGAALVAMETLADFGAVSVFNYDTFTTAIYKAWYGLFSVETALALALLLLGFVAIALAAEQLARGRGRHTAADSGTRAPVRLALTGPRGWLAFAFAVAVFAAGFLLPGIALVRWALEVAPIDLDARYVTYILRTLSLAGMAALACLALALALGYANRLSTGIAPRAAARIATLGYAIPGTVLAVGVVTVAWRPGRSFPLRSRAARAFGCRAPCSRCCSDTSRVFSPWLTARCWADSRASGPSLEEAARSLGLAPREILARLHLPLLGAGVGTALLLVFVDVMKEMPITLMTRPFGWDTLAVRVFEMTAEGEWQRAALPALAIVVAGLLPVVLLTWRMERAARAA